MEGNSASNKLLQEENLALKEEIKLLKEQIKEQDKTVSKALRAVDYWKEKYRLRQ